MNHDIYLVVQKLGNRWLLENRSTGRVVGEAPDTEQGRYALTQLAAAAVEAELMQAFKGESQ